MVGLKKKERIGRYMWSGLDDTLRALGTIVGRLAIRRESKRCHITVISVDTREEVLTVQY